MLNHVTHRTYQILYSNMNKCTLIFKRIICTTFSFTHSISRISKCTCFDLIDLFAVLNAFMQDSSRLMSDFALP